MDSIYQPSLASKGRRYFASVIDYTIFFIVYWLIVSEYGTITTSSMSVKTEIDGFPALFCFIFWLLPAIAEGLFGRSIGKFICDINVLNVDFKKASIGQCIVRHLFDLVDFFPFFGIVGLSVASSNSLNQRVGDLVAKTIVVKH